MTGIRDPQARPLDSKHCRVQLNRHSASSILEAYCSLQACHSSPCSCPCHGGQGGQPGATLGTGEASSWPQHGCLAGTLPEPGQSAAHPPSAGCLSTGPPPAPAPTNTLSAPSRLPTVLIVAHKSAFCCLKCQCRQQASLQPVQIYTMLRMSVLWTTALDKGGLLNADER